MRTLNRLWMYWMARYHGRNDGVRLIPDGISPVQPPFLGVLREWGNRYAGRLGAALQTGDRRLHPLYRRRTALWMERAAEVERTERAVTEARERWEARKTYENKKAWRRAERRAARARRAAARALERLETVVARRQVRFGSMRSQVDILHAEVRRLMQVYVAANLRAREDGVVPPGLREDDLPPLQVPECLREIRWDPPLARTGDRGDR